MELNFGRYKPALERQIQSWFWLNDYMRPWILSLDKLVEVQGADIVIDLVGFNELYTDRYFKGKVKDMAPKLIEQILIPNLGIFLKKIGYRGYSFGIVVRGRGELYKNTFNVKNPDWE
ncbi:MULTISPECIES: hypothetical protein [unclassified Pedobacter]|uniref:hypothetical protein n=1 Tax=unclassified Pedobacter TaxID=2628915 RepID=UPI00141F24CC|nr:MULTISPECIES: hypothetical protein [unclassified Pedobacter]NII81763.1 hypothetical protein [Pedobacter sp. SG908]NMN35765.1 hypothetical protein [Pedobacter sp. SG918]